MNHRNRTIGFVMVLLTLAAHMQTAEVPPLLWVALPVTFLGWPVAAYRMAVKSASPLTAELWNLRVDALIYGAWASALGFPLWLAFGLFVGATVNLTAFASVAGLVQAIAIFALGALPAQAAQGGAYRPETAGHVTALSIVSVTAYLLTVAYEAYLRSRRLHEMSAKGRESEEALHRQLEENRKLQTALREEANRDPMTGLFNRRYLEPTFDRELARCIREKRPIALLVMDVDHFKQVNDTYGHPAGDEVLKSLAARLTAGSRAEDIPCRLGGEEFLVVMPKMPLATALERAEAWRTSIAATPIQTAAGPISATISLGVASFPEHGETPTELLEAADAALYRAKKAGRNRVELALEVGHGPPRPLGT